MSSFKSTASSLSQRSSPFRRPASPSSPASHSSGRPTTPPSGRLGVSPMTSPSKLKQSYTVSDDEEEEEEEEKQPMVATPTKTRSQIPSTAHRTMAPISTQAQSPLTNRALPLPTKNNAAYGNRVPSLTMSGSDPLGRLPPALLHSLRESFAVLDPASTGTITPASAHETLQSLGLDTALLQTLFPPGSNQSITLPQYLGQLATVLVEMSPPQELLNAFSAFDDDDSGQVDIAELRQALISTPPDAGERALTERDIDQALAGYTGRRILGRNAAGLSGVRGMKTPVDHRKPGDVFRYQEFVGSFMGTGPDGRQSDQSIGTR